MKLPLGESPITSYPQYIHQLMPIISNENGKLWYLNNYIQIFVDEDSDEGAELRFREQVMCINMPMNLDNCTYLPTFLSGFYQIEDLSIFIDQNDFINKFKKLLDEEYYLIINSDRHLINKSTLGAIHDVFIYGYEEDYFYIVDFISDSGSLDYAKLYFDDVQAFYKTKYDSLPFYVPNINRLVAFKTKNFNYDFNMNLVKKQFEDYCSSHNSLDCFERLEKMNKDTIWGLQCYDTCISYLSKKYKNVDLRNIYVLKDHKTSMYDTIYYLYNNLNIGSLEIISKYQDIKNQIDTCLNLCIKYNLTGKERLIDSVCAILNTVKATERLIIYELLNYL